MQNSYLNMLPRLLRVQSLSHKKLPCCHQEGKWLVVDATDSDLSVLDEIELSQFEVVVPPLPELVNTMPPPVRQVSRMSGGQASQDNDDENE